jgi:hypothetical protein
MDLKLPVMTYLKKCHTWPHELVQLCNTRMAEVNNKMFLIVQHQMTLNNEMENIWNEALMV